MRIDCSFTENGICIIALKGRMHLKDLHEIETRLRTLISGRRAVVVDLTKLDFLFSMCLRSLILCSQSMEVKGGRLVLLAPTDNILSVLRASGVVNIMSVFRDRASAEAYVLLDREA